MGEKNERTYGQTHPVQDFYIDFIVHLGQPKGHFKQPELQNAHLVVQGGQ